jgi:hypothetical protein
VALGDVGGDSEKGLPLFWANIVEPQYPNYCLANAKRNETGNVCAATPSVTAAPKFPALEERLLDDVRGVGLFEGPKKNENIGKVAQRDSFLSPNCLHKFGVGATA